MANNSVAPGEQMAVAAFRHHRAIDRRAHGLLDPNLERVEKFLAGEERLSGFVPDGGNVVFPRLPAGIDSERLAAHLVKRYSSSSCRDGSSSRRATSGSASAASRRCSRAVSTTSQARWMISKGRTLAEVSDTSP
jgi:histidinol-phosphate/aromatic aminotransferase/cobyric acid decarboxylase-like protein